MSGKKGKSGRKSEHGPTIGVAFRLPENIVFDLYAMAELDKTKVRALVEQALTEFIARRHVAPKKRRNVSCAS